MHLCCNGAGGNLFHSFSLVCCFVSYIACLPACMFHSSTDLEPNMHTHTPRNHREHLSRCMMNAVGLLHRAFCAENHDFQLLLALRLTSHTSATDAADDDDDDDGDDRQHLVEYVEQNE